MSNSSANPKDFLSLKTSLSILPELLDAASTLEFNPLKGIEEYKNEIIEYTELIERTISETAPNLIKEGGIIKPGVSGELDYFRELLTGGENWSKQYEETEKEFIKQTDFLKAMGAKVIGVSEQSYSIQGKDQPIFEGKYVMNDEEWKLLTDGLNKLGQIAKDKGMMLTFHHHMGTVIQTEEEIDRFMNEVDKDLVYLLFDSGHCSFAGIDPVKVLSKYIDRTRHIHLKDLRSDVVAQSKKEGWSFLKGVREGTFTVPGDGDVDFAPIFDIIEKSGYEGYVVVEAEQDPAKANPLEYAMKARKYIAEKTGL